MNEAFIGLSVFFSLSVAFLLVLRLHHLLPDDHLSDESLAVVRLGIGVIATLSALVLSLVISTVEPNFDRAARDVRDFSGDLTQLDTNLRAFGPDAAAVRGLVAGYTAQAIRETWRDDDQTVDDEKAGSSLARVEDAFVALPARTGREVFYGKQVEQQFASLAAERQKLITDDAPALPPLFLVLVTFWLTILFASFGYRAPANGLVIATVLFVAAAVASALYLLVEMDGSFRGLIVVSDQPLLATLAAMRAS